MRACTSNAHNASDKRAPLNERTKCTHWVHRMRAYYARRARWTCRRLARRRRGAHNANTAQNLCCATQNPSAQARLRQCARRAKRAGKRTGTHQRIKFSEKTMTRARLFGCAYEPRVRTPRLSARLSRIGARIQLLTMIFRVGFDSASDGTHWVCCDAALRFQVTSFSFLEYEVANPNTTSEDSFSLRVRFCER